MKKCFMICFLLAFSIPLHAQKAVILVYPFFNDGTAEYAWLSAGITNTVVSDLDAVAGVSVVTEEERKRALKEIEFSLSDAADGEKAARAGKLTGADLIFSGHYTVINKKIRIVAKLIRVSSARIEKTVKLDGDLDDVFAVEDKIVLGLLSEAGKIKLENRTEIRLTEAEIRKIGDGARPDIMAFEYYSLGLEQLDGRPALALEYFEKALALEPEYREALIQAGSVAGIKLNRYSQALDYLFKAVALFAAADETGTNRYSSLLLTLGGVFGARGEDDKALEFFAMAARIKEALGLENSYGYAVLMMNFGAVYSHKGMLTEAVDYSVKSLTVMERLQLSNTAVYATLMMNIGTDVMRLGYFDKAEIFLNGSAAIRDGLGLANTLEQAMSYINLGVLSQAQGGLDAALERYAAAEKILSGLGLENHVKYATAVNNMGTVYEQKGDTEKAGRYYRRAYVIFESIKYEGPEKEQAKKRAEKYGQ